jgi:putative flippase GtrA
MPIRQLIRFGLAGILNTAVAYLAFALLLFLGLHYTLATLIGGAAGLIVGYYTTGGFVFGHCGDNRWLRFIATFAVIYFLNIGVQYFLRRYLDPYLSGALGTFASLLASFALNKWFVFRPAPARPSEYDDAYARAQIARSRDPLRRLVRAYYLRDIVRHVEGPAVDVGCGSGDLLARLPDGSLGLEINPAAVAYGRSIGLHVDLYDPESDGYRFEMLPPHKYRTVLFTHVLEHLDNPEQVLEAVFDAAPRTGIERVVVTLPCERGFAFDPTHRTFVNEPYLRDRGLFCRDDFSPLVVRRFPVNLRWLGRIYTFLELRVVFQRNVSDPRLPDRGMPTPPNP